MQKTGCFGVVGIVATDKTVQNKVAELRDQAIDTTANGITYVVENAPEAAEFAKDRTAAYIKYADKWAVQNLTVENVKAAAKEYSHFVNGCAMINPLVTYVGNKVTDQFIDAAIDNNIAAINQTASLIVKEEEVITTAVDFIVRNDEVLLDSAGNVLQGLVTIPRPAQEVLDVYYAAKNKLASIDGEDVLNTIGTVKAPFATMYDYVEDIIVNGPDKVRETLAEHGITYDNAMNALEFTQAKFNELPTIGQFADIAEKYAYNKAKEINDNIVSGITWGQGVLNNTAADVNNMYENLVDNANAFIENPRLTYDFIDMPSASELKDKGLTMLDYLYGVGTDGIKQAKGEVFAIGDAAIDGLNGIYEEVLTIPSYLKNELQDVPGKLFNNGVIDMFIPDKGTIDNLTSVIFPPLPQKVISLSSDGTFGLGLTYDGHFVGGYFKKELWGAEAGFTIKLNNGEQLDITFDGDIRSVQGPCPLANFIQSGLDVTQGYTTQSYAELLKKRLTEDDGSDNPGIELDPPTKIRVSGLKDDYDKWSYANGIYESTDGGQSYRITNPVEDVFTYNCWIQKSTTAWDDQGNFQDGFIFYLENSDPGNHAAIGTDICNLGTWRTLMYETWENQPVIERID